MDETTNKPVPIVPNYVTIYHAIEKLNEALRCDPASINTLFKILVPCLPELADTTVEAYTCDQVHLTNLLGILNSIFAYSTGTHQYRISAEFDENGISEFRLGIRTL